VVGSDFRDRLPLAAHYSRMKWSGALFAVVGVSLFTQACGDSSSNDPSGDSAGSTTGAAAGTASGSGGGSSGGAMAAAGSAGTPAGRGGTATSAGGSGAAGTAATGGVTTGGGATGGKSSGGAATTGGAASGGAGTAGGGAGGAPAGGAGGAPTNGGSGGGVNNDGPCPVPSYIASEPKPIGWASQGTATTGGGSATPVLVTTLAQFKTEVAGSAAKVIYVKGEFAADKISIGSGSSNVIVRNLKISGYGVGDCSKDPSYDSATGCSSGDDAISVNGSAHHVWFDHCLIMDGTDGNLDITNDADFVTVSWTKFAYTPRTDNQGDDSTGAAGHRFSNLVGGTDTAPTNWPSTRPLNVTWHHNWWADNVVERQPRVRYGRNHLFNNYYNSSASNYCVRAGIEASILLEANAFDGVKSPHQFNNTDNESTAYIELGTGDRANSYVSTSGTKVDQGGGSKFTPPYTYQVDAASAVAAAVKANAGPH